MKEIGLLIPSAEGNRIVSNPEKLAETIKKVAAKKRDSARAVDDPSEDLRLEDVVFPDPPVRVLTEPASFDEAAKVAFDIAVNSLDFGSGFLDDEDVMALRYLARRFGVNERFAEPPGWKLPPTTSP